MAGYETGSMGNDPSASVCEHGQLKRKCEVCSERKPRAIEAEARVAELEDFIVTLGNCAQREMCGHCAEDLDNILKTIKP